MRLTIRLVHLMNFKTAFSAAAATQFGSGWAWLMCFKRWAIGGLFNPESRQPSDAWHCL